MIKQSFTKVGSELNFVTIICQNVSDVQYGKTRNSLHPVFDQQKCFIVFPIKQIEGTSQLISLVYPI